MSSEQSGMGSTLGAVGEIAGASATAMRSPVQAWHEAREGTQQLASALPDVTGLEEIKHFIRRHPVVCACAALAVGYIILGAYLPVVGTVTRQMRRR